MKLNELGRLLFVKVTYNLYSSRCTTKNFCILYKIIAQIYVLFEKKPYLCGINHTRYKIMLAIVLKHSTFNRVTTRLRYAGSHVEFLSLPCRIIHDSGFTYLYFHSLSDLCTASDFLSAYNAVYRVADLSL